MVREFITSNRPPLRRRAARSRLRFLGAALGSALAMLVVASTTVFAGEGNSNYLGILSSTAPSGYKPSPTWYDLSAGQNVVNFQFTVTNKNAEKHEMSVL